MTKKRVTREDVAERAGVSTAVVSYVVNNGPRPVSPETKERVKKAIAELEYYPTAAARTLRSKRTYRIGFVLTYPITSINEYMSLLLNGALRAAEELGYSLVLYPLTADHLGLLKRISRAREVDGVLLMEAPQSDQMVSFLVQESFPFVALGHPVSNAAASYVASNHQQGAELTMRHLVELGHRRIAFLNYPELVYTGSELLKAYSASLKKARFAFNNDLVFSCYGSEPEEWVPTIEQLLDLAEPPTAIFTAHDLLALQVLQVCNARGLRVPQDIAVAGYNDIPTSRYTTPPLTTVHEPLVRTGRNGLEALIAQLEGKNQPPLRLTLPVDLMIRRSTADTDA